MRKYIQVLNGRFNILLMSLIVGITPSLTLLVPVSAAPSAPQVVSFDSVGNKIKNLTNITMSRDGKYVAFIDKHNELNQGQVTVRDLTTGVSTRELSAWNDVRDVTITDSGRYLYFSSLEHYIDPQFPQVGGNVPHVYVKDRITNKIALAEVGANNTSVWNPTIQQRLEPSDDGKIFAGQCSFTPYTICVRNIETKVTTEYSNGGRFERLSGDGRYFFFEDSDGKHQRHDIIDNTDMDLSSSIPSNNGILASSSDGNYVLFYEGSNVTNLPVYRLNILTGEQQLAHGISGALGNNPGGQLSGDGNIAMSFVGNVRPSIVTYNFNTDTSSQPIVNNWGNSADEGVHINPYSFSNLLTFDGSAVAFLSTSTNLGCPDVSGEMCGYIASATGPIIIGEDTTKPQIQQVTPSIISKDQCDTVDFTVNSTDDNSGVASGEFYVMGGPLDENGNLNSIAGGVIKNTNGTFVGTISTGIPEGDYPVEVRVQDFAGNWSSKATAQLHVVSTSTCPDPQPEIDPNADSIPPVLGQPMWTYNPKRLDQQSTMTVSANDDNSGLTIGEYYLCDSDPGVHNGIPMAFDGDVFSLFADESVPAGSYNVCMRAFDRAGNVSVPVSTLFLVGNDFDATPPMVTGTPDRAANANGWYNSPVTITWNSNDPAPSSGTPTTPAPTVASLQGVNTYTSDPSCDPLNNCATGSYQVNHDSVLPLGTFTGSQAVIRLLGRTISGTSSDVTSGVSRITLSTGTTTLSSDTGGGLTLSCNAARTSCTWTATASRLLGGVNTYTLAVTDLAGNAFTITRQYTVI